MLRLKNIIKDYKMSDSAVRALDGVNIGFRESEFVSVLGPSGCGKTTLLNLIGGLDQYTSGDLLIEGKSTKKFADKDWDAYRNDVIGFVFQNYNLIGHQTVLDNVAIALTLSGVSLSERHSRANQALEKVGLADQAHKKPNQLSGGQKQRVAIARAIVNNPKILMADEPTGALDSKTSVQILDILKSISRDRLVIMVTHNQELAEQYSDRIVKLYDGRVVDDTNPISTDDTAETRKMRSTKTSMSFLTALKLSFKNLMTKKKRTIITSIAGSIGIIGVALVLAISGGMSSYIETLQRDTLAGYPILISKNVQAFGRVDDSGGVLSNSETGNNKFPDGDTIYAYDSQASRIEHTNVITSEFMDYIDEMDKNWTNAITYSYGMEMNVLAKTDDGAYKKVNTSSGTNFMGVSSGRCYFNEMPDSMDFVMTQYDVLDGRYPTSESELALIVDKYNRLDVRVLSEFGIRVEESYTFSDFIGRELKVISNNNFYEENSGVFTERTSFDKSLYDNGFSVSIVGVLRVQESASSELLSSGLGYTPALTQKMLTDAQASNVAQAQVLAGDAINVLTGNEFNPSDPYITYGNIMLKLGADIVPIGIQFYPPNFDSKTKIKSYLDAYNVGRAVSEQIVYSDPAEMLTDTMSIIVSTISVILVAFAAISLVVSTIMIGIITYVSVVERTKEIGILRAIGARKKDISRVFNAEAMIIGFVAGVMGVLVACVLSFPINVIVARLVGVSNVASLSVFHALFLIVGSTTLTLIGGLLPSRSAAKKDPVLALRAE